MASRWECFVVFESFGAVKDRDGRRHVLEIPGVVLSDRLGRRRVSSAKAPKSNAFDVDLHVSGPYVDDRREEARCFAALLVVRAVTV